MKSISIATAYWAAHLGCSSEELFESPLRIVLHSADLADYCGVFALFREGGAIASIPSDYAGKLRPILSGLSGGCSPASFASALGSVAAAVIGPAYIGYASRAIAPEGSARALGAADAPLLRALQQSCDATEWEHGGSPGDHPSSGVFAGSQLVAVAGYEIWGGRIAHISVITHPDYRGRGWGRSAVAHVAQRAVCAGLLPQYRTLESNRASVRIAESLGFESYAKSIAVRLKPNA